MIIRSHVVNVFVHVRGLMLLQRVVDIVVNMAVATDCQRQVLRVWEAKAGLKMRIPFKIALMHISHSILKK